MITTQATPILFLVFNRPDTTERVFKAIRQVKPHKLYVAADGPRPDKEGDASDVQAVRDYVMSNIDWDCHVQTLFRDTNLGCRKAVGEAITWFFEHEEAGIILEDDCFPDPSFFPFCTELLDRYRDAPRIAAITGCCFQPEGFTSDASYFFSRYPFIWGWATWSRAWKYYKQDLSEYPKLFDLEWLSHLLGSQIAARYWTKILRRYQDNKPRFSIGRF